MILSYRPIGDTWPGELREERENPRFDKSWGQVTEILARECEIAARDGDVVVALQLAVPESAIRSDGQLKEGRRPDHPGVIISFDTPDGPLRFSCDTFDGYWEGSPADAWRYNVQAIAYAMEALRKIERYGLGRGDEQYKGFRALPPGTVMGSAEPAMSYQAAADMLAAVTAFDASDMLEGSRAARYGAIAAAYRQAVRERHPDQGGDEEEFRHLTRARDVLNVSVAP